MSAGVCFIANRRDSNVTSAQQRASLRVLLKPNRQPLLHTVGLGVGAGVGLAVGAAVGAAVGEA